MHFIEEIISLSLSLGHEFVVLAHDAKPADFGGACQYRDKKRCDMVDGHTNLFEACHNLLIGSI